MYFFLIQLFLLTLGSFAFATIDPKTFEVRLPDKDSSSLLKRLTAQKRFHPGLQVWIAIGGWSFSERNSTTFTTFSDLAASVDNQKIFFSSLNRFLHEHRLDGVDIDWYVNFVWAERETH
jgi:chitinase